MAKKIKQEVSIEDQLREDAVKVANEEYEIELSEEDLHDMRERLVNELLEVDSLTEELKAYSDEREVAIKSILDVIENRKKAIKTQSLSAKGELFYVPNIEENKMNVYNSSKILIRTEPLKEIPMFKGNGQPFSNAGESEFKEEELG